MKGHEAVGTLVGDRGMPNEGTRIVREEEMPTLTGLSRTTRWRLIRRGDFPPPRQLSPGAVGWLRREVDEWVASRPTARPRIDSPSVNRRMRVAHDHS